jgi:multiple sugar transport system permease protein
MGAARSDKPAYVKRMTSAERIFVAAIVVPALLHFFLFTALPVLSSFAISFTEWAILGDAKFIGLKNYTELARDDKFLECLRNTLLFTLYYVPPMLVFPLGLALLINQPTKAAQFFKSVYFLPVVTSFVVFALIFKWIFSADQLSFANIFVRKIGFRPQPWLQNEHLALPLLALLGLLKGAAWNMIYFLAGLQSIPDTFYEAAKVDGANRWKTFWNITLPLLRPTMFFVSVLTVIGGFQVFDSAYLLTQGGPGNSTTTIVYFIYQAGFENFRMGYASASAYVLLAMVLVVTYVQKRWLGRPADWY